MASESGWKQHPSDSTRMYWLSPWPQNLARLAWSMLAKGRDYDANFMGHTA